ncbi:MAG TPA: nuclear transport factor 2 family protein [Candidatus Limnocylindrales bacterium]
MTFEMTWRAEPADETIRDEDAAAIRACILDYFDGWFDGDADRMDRALHPGLAKHAVGQGPERGNALDVTTKAEMVAATRQGRGRARDLPDRAIRIDIASVSGDIASVVVHSAVYVEYALLARTSTGWQITSTLWHWAAGHGPRA